MQAMLGFLLQDFQEKKGVSQPSNALPVTT